MTNTPSLVGGRYQLRKKLGAGAMGAVYLALDRLTGDTVALKRVNITPVRFSTPPFPIAMESPLSEKPAHLDSTALNAPTLIDSHPVPKHTTPAWSASSPVDNLTTPFQETDIDTLNLPAEEKTILLQAIAREFQTLASLRHPHIISVLDYGFDTKSPYFTMSLLSNPQTILEAGQGKSTDERVHLLMQMLEALNYLHQRGILHHDLKPDNVLVGEEGVKVLDFGLAAAKGTEVTGGTMFYMAPEVLKGGQVTEAADLYAVGVMAYQLFAGRHPFDTQNFILNVLTQSPDLSLMDVSPELQQVVGKLLEREQQRYTSAYEVMVDLSTAINRPLPPEDEAIRESYLQAAQFVGREDEMDELLWALGQSRAGQGQTWLLSGSSGVGKSRLVRELRIHALIQGVLVVTGQAIREGALPYQIWRDPLRRLVLMTELSSLQASVLKQLIPDLPQLLDKEIPDAPTLDQQAAQQRLFSVITSLFQQQEETILLNLEDLHWAGEESLALLRQLMRVMGKVSLMILGSYRPEERPDLPQELPNAQLMELKPLNEQAMIDLSVSMLGDIGQQPEILDFLQRETEGNAFFLVEVVRTLAEEAGRLRQIGEMILPASVFPDGIRSVVQRRLAKVPAWAQPLLRLVAVAGRRLDMALMPALAPDLDLNQWLTTCAKLVVLERQEGQWQLSHDKLREGLLTDLRSDERIPLHAQVAQAMEEIYPHNPEKAAVLTHHWHEAQQPDKERYYARLAGEHATTQYAHDEATTYLNRALALTPVSDIHTQYELLLAREKIYDWRGQREAQAQDLATLTALASQLSPEQQTEITLRQANYALAINDYAGTITHAQQAVTQAYSQRQQAYAHYLWGSSLFKQASFQEAQKQLQKAQTLANQVDDQQVAFGSLFQLGMIERTRGEYSKALKSFNHLIQVCQKMNQPLRELEALHGLGVVSEFQGDLEQATQYFRKSLAIAQRIGHRLQEAKQLVKLGAVVEKQQAYDQARDHYEQWMVIGREIGDKAGEGHVFGNLGFLAWRLGQQKEAISFYQQALQIARAIPMQFLEGVSLINLGHANHDIGNSEQAIAYIKEAETIFRKLEHETWLGYVLNGLGMIMGDQGVYEQAIRYHQEALTIRRSLKSEAVIMEDLVGLAQATLSQGQKEKAQSYLEEVLAYLPQNPAMQGAERPMRIYLLCHLVLQALNDPRSATLLLDAYDLLAEQAEKLADPEAQRSFLEDVPTHYKLMTLCKERFG